MALLHLLHELMSCVGQIVLFCCIEIWFGRSKRLCHYCLLVQATIDQVDGLIFFDGSSEQLLQWDTQIQAVCNQLNVIVEDLISNDVSLQV